MKIFDKFPVKSFEKVVVLTPGLLLDEDTDDNDSLDTNRLDDSCNSLIFNIS